MLDVYFRHSQDPGPDIGDGWVMIGRQLLGLERVYVNQACEGICHEAPPSITLDSLTGLAQEAVNFYAKNGHCSQSKAMERIMMIGVYEYYLRHIAKTDKEENEEGDTE